MNEIAHADPLLLADIRQLIDAARQRAAAEFNAELTLLYWQVGKRIHLETLKGTRAEYGERVVATLAQQLTTTYGRGWSEKQLRHCLRFAETFPEESIVSALRRQLFFYNRKLRRLVAIDLKLGEFRAKGDIHVFVDECHRTQSGELHKAMKTFLPDALLIGFTGTPLLKADKQKSIEVFGRYIHTYRFNEAVADGVVLDLRYEARDIDQNITSQKKIDQWFEAKTKGLTDLAKAQLKQRWGTLQKVLSSQSRLEKIVADILMDMETRDRLQSGRGNTMLVSGSIYQACKFYELFAKTDLAGKCAIVTSYRPSPNDLKGEESGEGMTERLRKYDIYQRMLADWFNEPAETAVNKAEDFEKAVKKKFIDEPGQMKLLIVVDKLLTGFDAPPATYLYIDKKMENHGLFQAICRVNRLDGDDNVGQR